MDVARRAALQSLATAAGFSGLTLSGSRRLTDPVPRAGHSTGRAWSVEGLPSPEMVMSWIELVNSRFGPRRLTGDGTRRGFVDWLDKMLSSVGFSVQRDPSTGALIATLPGASDEIMAISALTDGMNIIEEGGALAVLALGMQAALLPQRRRGRSLALYLAIGPHGNVGADVVGAWRDHPDLAAKTVVTLSAGQQYAKPWTRTGRGVGQVPAADHTVTASLSREPDKLDPDIVYAQVTALAEMARRLNGLSARQIAAFDPVPATLPADMGYAASSEWSSTARRRKGLTPVAPGRAC